MKYYITSLLLSVCFLLSCRKRDDTDLRLSLPEKTQSGKNSFGFLLNSQVWTNYGSVFNLGQGNRPNLEGYYASEDGFIEIRADKELKNKGARLSLETIRLYLETNLQGTRTYSTLTGDDISIGYTLTLPNEPEKEYLLSNTDPVFTITLSKIDAAAKILSGEFSGKLFLRLGQQDFQTSLTDSIVVADGRFDIKLP